jgi:hypothetical protein
VVTGKSCEDCPVWASNITLNDLQGDLQLRAFLLWRDFAEDESDFSSFLAVSDIGLSSESTTDRDFE